MTCCTVEATSCGYVSPRFTFCNSKLFTIKLGQLQTWQATLYTHTHTDPNGHFPRKPGFACFPFIFHPFWRIFGDDVEIFTGQTSFPYQTNIVKAFSDDVIMRLYRTPDISDISCSPFGLWYNEVRLYIQYSGARKTSEPSSAVSGQRTEWQHRHDHFLDTVSVLLRCFLQTPSEYTQ